MPGGWGWRSGPRSRRSGRRPASGWSPPTPPKAEHHPGRAPPGACPPVLAHGIVRRTHHATGERNPMSDKPSYLGLLNAIAVNEARAHQYLQVWIDKTTDPDVKAVLRTVAWREGEHGMSFAKRVNELGYELRDRDDLNLADRLD